jgi:ectoine hydroxylase-related dioxygenase (phytanoyl-CoA dioxygenase family)
MNVGLSRTTRKGAATAIEETAMDVDSKREQLRDEGFCVFPSVLTPGELERARTALDRAIEIEKRVMGSTHIRSIDPNANSVRVNNLPAADPVFVELLTRSDAMTAVEAVLGPHFLVSNFTANIALPGSGSMNLHSDQALVVPGPWLHPWAINIIWCLDDVHETNGSTRYLAGSHRFTSLEEVPEDGIEKTVAFEAPAGSFIAMEGRLWHTSGRNVAREGRRRMMFAYYAADFLRQQMNWTRTLPQAVQDGMDDRTRALFGLSPGGNTRIGAALTKLKQPAGAAAA